ncbi:cathepsin B-like cysteine proteinase 4 [Diaphorina citri]|uniref:Cathepsin B-like cysteine proteinase 4 n=1 Tax=Diaphorina citri TaxID=121845 RepID=A0A1S3CV00_DIACI|nr:cathepsin B-like cysteine proteinase 4 [Diaphorina citri]KAI5749252.1 hypothetical protein M8J76_005914 [Diaphorina citri]
MFLRPFSSCFCYALVIVVLVLQLCFHCNAYQFRQEAFSAEFISDINANAHTWQAGHNFPSNIIREELGFLLDLSEPTLHQSVDFGDINSWRRPDNSYGEEEIPVSFDARVRWPECNIGKVLDQGACPSSYAFAVVPAFSDRRCILSNGQHKDPLSIEYLLSCCHACKFDDTTRVCGAGQAITAWWFLHKRGIVTGGEYGSKQGCQPVSFPPCRRSFSSQGSSCKNQTAPQLRCHTRCTNEDYPIPYRQDRHRGKIQYYVSTNVTSIQREILTNGPATAQITVYEDFLHYKSGVYKHIRGKRFAHQHTLKLIGWGVDKRTPYWLLINSWGKLWGDQGTIKILRGKAECNLEYYVTASIPKRDL